MLSVGRVCRILALAGPAWLAGVAAAQQDGQSAPAPQAEKTERVAPEAQRVLDRLKTHYRSLKGVTVTATMSSTMKEGDEERREEHGMTIAAARPNRLSVRPADDGDQEFAMVSDGTTMWLYAGPPVNRYEEGAAPEGFGGLIEKGMMGQPAEGPMLFIAPHVVALALLDGTRFDKMIGDAAKVNYVGAEDLGGKPHDRIRLAGDRLDVDLWVAAGGEAWLSRIRPDLARMFGGMGDEARLPVIQSEFKDWKAREEFEPGAFVFKPPEGAEKVESLAAAMGYDDGEEPGHAALMGRPAPELDLDLLGGGKLSLAAHRGKDVVVLDFWATWCGPCVRGLPLVSKAAEEVKGVVFYAVNQQEAEGVIREFLEKKDLKIKVPLDKDGKAGEAYGVSGIPQTVLIGKDGTVQAVHVGFAPGMEKELKEQLEQLVKGEALVKEGKKEEGRP